VATYVLDHRLEGERARLSLMSRLVAARAAPRVRQARRSPRRRVPRALRRPAVVDAGDRPHRRPRARRL